MLALDLLIASVASVLHFYLMSVNTNNYSEGKETTFMPRLIILSSVLVFVLSINKPSKPFTVQGVYEFPPYAIFVFGYIVQLSAVLAMFVLGEPALAILPIMFTIYTGCVSTQNSVAPENTSFSWIWPVVTSVLLGVVTFFFFSDIKEFDELLNDIFSWSGFPPSAKPKGYISDEGTFMVSPIATALLVTAIAFAAFWFSIRYRDLYMTGKPVTSQILNPSAEGEENLARFLSAAQYQYVDQLDHPLDKSGPMRYFIHDRQFKHNIVKNGVQERSAVTNIDKVILKKRKLRTGQKSKR